MVQLRRVCLSAPMYKHPIDYVTRIGNSSRAPIVIVDFATAYPAWLRFFAEFCAGFQLFSPKEYVDNSLE